MTNREATHFVQTVIELVEELGLDASDKIAVLETSAEVIKKTVQAEVMRVALFNALKI